MVILSRSRSQHCKDRGGYWLTIAWRVLLETVLSLIGLLHISAALRQHPRRKRIVFQAYSAHLAQFFTPIIAKLQQEEPELDIHFIVLPHPHFSFSSLRALCTFARDRLKVPSRNVRFFWQVLWQKYDLLVCTDVYARFPLRHTKKVLLKHGVGVTSRMLTRHPLRKTIFDFDLVLVSGEADCDLLRRFCAVGFALEKVIAVGLPYLDRLQTCPETRDAYLRRMSLEPYKSVVLVAPSWRGLQVIQALEPDYFDDLITVLRELDLQVIIKMHACSFNEAMVQGEDWAAKLRRYAQPGVGIDYDVDDVPALLHADILITDISSRAFNFMLLDKPVITVFPDDLFVDQFDRERIQLMRRGSFHARSPTEVKSVIAHRLSRGDPLHPERRRLLQRCFANPGRATEVVVEHLLRHIHEGV